MIDKKLINLLFPDNSSVEMLSSKNIDTISSKFLGGKAIVPYKIIDVNNNDCRVVVKHKNSLVVPLGAMALSPSFGVFLKVIGAHRIFGFNNGHVRDKLFYEKIDDSLRGALPHFIGAKESLGKQNVSLVLTEFPQSQKIDNDDLRKILDSITDFHAKYYGKTEVIKEMKLNHYTPDDYRRARGTLRALFEYYYDDNIKIYGKELTSILSEFIDNIDNEYAATMEHQTLTHNDFTPRNIYVNDKKVIIYDWELACYQNPEHDLIELLFTTVDDSFTTEQIRKLIVYFRQQLAKKTKQETNNDVFAKIMRFNALEYVVNRLAIFRSYSKRYQCSLANRCERNARKVLEACL